MSLRLLGLSLLLYVVMLFFNVSVLIQTSSLSISTGRMSSSPSTGQTATGVDTATLKLLIAILLSCPRDGDPHAVTGFWSTWSNSLYQLRLLDALLSLPADTFNFVQLPGHRIVTVDDVSVASPTIKALAANVQVTRGIPLSSLKSLCG